MREIVELFRHGAAQHKGVLTRSTTATFLLKQLQQNGNGFAAHKSLRNRLGALRSVLNQTVRVEFFGKGRSKGFQADGGGIEIGHVLRELVLCAYDFAFASVSTCEVVEAEAKKRDARWIVARLLQLVLGVRWRKRL